MNATPQVLWDLIEEHLDEAGFQWERWERALVSPLLRARQVADGVEARLAAHIEGLCVAGTAAVDRLLEPALHEREPGAAAAAATAILELNGGVARVRAALASVEEGRRPALMRALALSRHPDPERDLLPLLGDEHPAVVAAGLDALAHRGIDPGPVLLRFLTSGDTTLAVPALRAAASSGQPVRALLERAWRAGEPAVRDAALETGLRLGFRAALLTCQRLVEATDPSAGRALALLAMSGDANELPLIEKALTAKELRLPALVALGYTGRTSCIEALFSVMEDPGLARVAGEAFSAMTGIAIDGELRAEELDDTEEPVRFEEDEREDDLIPGPEAELPVPDARAVVARWRSLRARFDTSKRYLHGKPFSPQGLVECFTSAPMRRRHLLSLELAIRSRGAHRLATRDWVIEQLRGEHRQQLSVRSEAGLPFSRLLLD